MAEENSPRGSPEAAAVATVPVVAAAAPASSLQQTDLNKRISDAKTPAEFAAVKKEAMATMQRNLTAKPGSITQPVVPAPVEPAPAEITAEVTTETATEETPAAEVPEATALETEDDGGEGPISPIAGKRTHLRLPENDKVGRLAASFMKRNRDMPMAEAMKRAEEHLGVKPQVTPEPVAESNGLPESVDETQAAIAAMRADRKKANAELRFEDASDLSDKLEDLIQHKNNLERQGERKQVEAASAYDQKFSASESRATELYEFAGNPDSAGAKRMLEIEEDLKDNNDPLYSSPDKPLRIAQMVAAELKIAPRRKGQPAAPVKPAAPAVPVQKKQVIPGGGSSTTPPSTLQPAINAEITGIKSMNELRNMRKKLGLPV